MIDFVIVLILVVVVGSALAYIVREKKKGNCVGCPDGCQGCHGCHTNDMTSTCGCNSKANTACGGHTNTK
ncbi:MAG: hypothetical protein Q4C52_01915 [Eubacteriales bacterium]|nr:hypothetical protein [Eubacteriales bacterium]